MKNLNSLGLKVENHSIYVLDQTLLPKQEVWCEVETPADWTCPARVGERVGHVPLRIYSQPVPPGAGYHSALGYTVAGPGHRYLQAADRAAAQRQARLPTSSKAAIIEALMQRDPVVKWYDPETGVPPLTQHSLPRSLPFPVSLFPRDLARYAKSKRVCFLIGLAATNRHASVQ